MTIKIYDLKKGRVDAFKKKVSSLNRKAVKFGSKEIVYTFGEVYTKEEVVSSGNTLYVEYVPVSIEFPAPDSITVYNPDNKVSGNWTFLAFIEPCIVDGSYLNAIYNMSNDDLSNLRTTELICEHCNTNRYRKRFYVLKCEETSLVKVVGSTCLKDFLGKEPSAQLFAINSERLVERVIKDIDELYSVHGARDEYQVGIELAINLIVWHFKQNGFISSSNIGGGTADCVGTIITRNDGAVFFSDSDLSDAKDIYNNWGGIFSNTSDDGVRSLKDTDYNIYRYMKLERVTIFGRAWNSFVGLVYYTYRKLMNEKAARDTNNSEFFGEVGKREKFSLHFLKEIIIDGGIYGPKTIYTGIVKDTDNQFVWYAAGARDDFEKGKEYMVKATVKNHENSSKYGKQTILSRVSIVS